MRTPATRERSLLFVAAAAIAAAVLVAPSAEATRYLPNVLETPTMPRLERLDASDDLARQPFALLTSEDLSLLAAAARLDAAEAGAILGRDRLRLFPELDPLPRRLETVAIPDLASGVFSIEIGSNILQKQDFTLELRWPIDLYAFVGWGPHMGTDPMGMELIGHIYRIRGVMDGVPVEYVGSAKDLRARFSKHKWKQLIYDDRTTITAERVEADLDVRGSRRGTLRAARGEALRSAEQGTMDAVEDARATVDDERVSLNRRRASVDPETLRVRHNVKKSEPFTVKRPGAAINFPMVIDVYSTIRDAYLQAKESREARFSWAPYVLEDENGVFVLEVEERLLAPNKHYKVYINEQGEVESREGIDRSKFLDLEEEAEALWGTTDWRGDFVPGLLRPSLPPAGPVI